MEMRGSPSSSCFDRKQKLPVPTPPSAFPLFLDPSLFLSFNVLVNRSWGVLCLFVCFRPCGWIGRVSLYFYSRGR